MSGTIALPAGIEVGPALAGPTVTIETAPAAPYGLPPYPLSANPAQTWSLELVNGQPTWVQFTAPPGQTAIALEDAIGGLMLEDGDGYFLMEA